MEEKPRFRRVRFGLRTLFELIAVVAFILTLLYYRQTAIQQNGRYQVDQSPSGNILLVDTQTGQVWDDFQGNWDAMPAPPK
jgi:hypothetical protein